jgi:hypothetical protein
VVRFGIEDVRVALVPSHGGRLIAGRNRNKLNARPRDLTAQRSTRLPVRIGFRDGGNAWPELDQDFSRHRRAGADRLCGRSRAEGENN